MKRSRLRRVRKGGRRYGNKAVLQAWRERFESCAVCGAHSRQFGTNLQLHHLLNGKYGRPDADFNFLMLCELHHEQLGTGLDNLAVLMTLKELVDPEGYDLEAMRQHAARFKRLLPDPAPLPGWILELRGEQ